MKIVFLGTGASEPIPLPGCRCRACEEARAYGYRRTHTSIAIEFGDTLVVVDAGSQNLVPYLEHNIDKFKRIAILLTHWHADHYLELYRIRWIPREIEVYAPREGVDEELLTNPQNLRISFTDEDRRLDIEDITIYSVKLIHSVKTLGYVVKHSDRRAAFLFDTKGLPIETMERLKEMKLDLLVIDATYPPNSATDSHNGVDDAIDIALSLKPRTAILTHISHRNLPHTELSRYVDKRCSICIVAMDGLSIEF